MSLKSLLKGWTPFAGLLLVALLIVLLVHALGTSPREEAVPHHRVETLARLEQPLSVPAPSAARQEDGQWTMPAGDYASTRYSGLDQINAGNVGNLRPVFTFDTGIDRGHEAAPLVVGSTMYVVTPFPNTVFAFDLANLSRPKWVFRPQPVQAAQGVACCDVVNRGMTFDNGRLFFNTLDGATIALDAESGRQIWRTQLANIMIARRSPWRPSSPMPACWSAIPAASSAFAAGSPRSMPALALWCGRPGRPAPTATS